MAGMRPLTELEYNRVKNSFNNLRDKCLFVLGCKTGYRVTELLSLNIESVYNSEYKRIKDRVKVYRRNMKGKTESRESILDSEVKQVLFEYIQSIEYVNPNAPLFPSRKGLNKSITRVAAHIILKNAYDQADVTESVATHTMRKTYAVKVYKNSGNDLRLTQKALGHKFITTTTEYLPVTQESIDKIVAPEMFEVENDNVIHLRRIK